jgi:putative membrane protein
MKIVKLTGVSLLLICSAIGCSKGSDTQAAAASEGDEAAPAEHQMSTMTDGQMLQVLDTIDTGEIAQAELATTKAQSPQVREFAASMIEQHNRAKKQGAQLASQANMTRTPSALSSKLETKGQGTLTKLQGTEADAFDAAYMKAQVKQHQEVLNTLDEQLIPSASSTAMRNQLTAARTMVQHHLMQAEELQANTK